MFLFILSGLSFILIVCLFYRFNNSCKSPRVNLFTFLSAASVIAGVICGHEYAAGFILLGLAVFFAAIDMIWRKAGD